MEATGDRRANRSRDSHQLDRAGAKLRKHGRVPRPTDCSERVGAVGLPDSPLIVSAASFMRGFIG